MCYGGGGGGSRSVDPELEAQQKAQKEKEQAEATMLKRQSLNQAVTRSTPLVNQPSLPSTSKIPQNYFNQPKLNAGVDAALEKRSADTIIRRRRGSRGRRSLITGSGGGIGFYSKYRT